MHLDIRLPIGLLFTVIGFLLALFGAFSDVSLYARALGHNVNLWWGMVLLVFGLTFVYFGSRASRSRGQTTSDVA